MLRNKKKEKQQRKQKEYVLTTFWADFPHADLRAFFFSFF